VPILPLSDGRSLSWAEYGDPDGQPLVVLHGTPGSRLQVQGLHAAATRAGVRVIAPERPGYGLSNPVPTLTFRSYVEDLRQLLAELGVDRVVLCGVSGGGGFALAAAAELPELVRRLVMVCAMVPSPGEARKGMSRENRILLWFARHAPSLLRRSAEKQLGADPSSPSAAKRRARLPAADRRVVGQYLEEFAADRREAIRQGAAAAAAAVHELGLYGRPLGVDPTTISTPTVLLHGELDVNVPAGVARWLCRQLPHAELQMVPDAGHVFLLEQPGLLVDLVGQPSA
jgi:pimeloyl-ACP methyl ester carboxylesterase